MKIIQVAPYFYPHIGGVESHVFDLSRHLMRRGHRVVVLTSDYGGLKERENVMGIPVRRVKALTVRFSTPVTPSIKKAISEEGGDIIHSHSPPPLSSYYAGKASRRSGIPHVMTYHCDLEIPVFGGSRIVGFYRRTLGKATLKMTDRLIATTETYASTSRDIWRKDVDIIPNAVDEKRFNPSISGRKVREELGISGGMVLYVGRLVFHKGVEYLIESARYTDATYVIVGTGEKERELRRLVERKGLEKRVIFTGKVPYDRLPEYYAAADVFVLPSVSRLEAFGIVALEAMATATPVIVSDIPGVSEVIEDGVQGIRAERMDAGDFGRKIAMLLGNDALRKEMGRNGRKLVEKKYTWEKVVEMVERVYREVEEGR